MSRVKMELLEVKLFELKINRNFSIKKSWNSCEEVQYHSNSCDEVAHVEMEVDLTEVSGVLVSGSDQI